MQAAHFGTEGQKWQNEEQKQTRKEAFTVQFWVNYTLKGGEPYNNPTGLYVQHAQLPQTLSVSPQWTWADAKVFDSLQRAGIRDSYYLRNCGPLVGGSRVAGLSLALSLWGGGGVQVNQE